MLHLISQYQSIKSNHWMQHSTSLTSFNQQIHKCEKEAKYQPEMGSYLFGNAMPCWIFIWMWISRLYFLFHCVKDIGLFDQFQNAFLNQTRGRRQYITGWWCRWSAAGIVIASEISEILFDEGKKYYARAREILFSSQNSWLDKTSVTDSILVKDGKLCWNINTNCILHRKRLSYFKLLVQMNYSFPLQNISIVFRAALNDFDKSGFARWLLCPMWSTFSSKTYAKEG